MCLENSAKIKNLIWERDLSFPPLFHSLSDIPIFYIQTGDYPNLVYSFKMNFNSVPEILRLISAGAPIFENSKGAKIKFYQILKYYFSNSGGRHKHIFIKSGGRGGQKVPCPCFLANQQHRIGRKRNKKIAFFRIFELLTILAIKKTCI